MAIEDVEGTNQGAKTYLTQDLISDSATVEALDALHIKVLEDHWVAQVLIVAHLLQCQPNNQSL